MFLSLAKSLWAKSTILAELGKGIWLSGLLPGPHWEGWLDDGRGGGRLVLQVAFWIAEFADGGGEF